MLTGFLYFYNHEFIKQNKTNGIPHKLFFRSWHHLVGDIVVDIRNVLILNNLMYGFWAQPFTIVF